MAQTDLTTLLADELKKVLGLESSFELDMDEEFAHYGMNSIVSARYSHVLTEKLGQEIAPKLLVEHCSIARLAAHLDELLPAGKLAESAAQPATAQPQAEKPASVKPPVQTQTASSNSSGRVKYELVEKIIEALKSGPVSIDSEQPNKNTETAQQAPKASSTTQVPFQNYQAQGDIDFSFIFFSSSSKSVTQEGNDKYQYVQRIAEFADQNGFKALWMPERHWC